MTDHAELLPVDPTQARKFMRDSFAWSDPLSRAALNIDLSRGEIYAFLPKGSEFTSFDYITPASEARVSIASVIEDLAQFIVTQAATLPNPAALFSSQCRSADSCLNRINMPLLALEDADGSLCGLLTGSHLSSAPAVTNALNEMRPFTGFVVLCANWTEAATSQHKLKLLEDLTSSAQFIASTAFDDFGFLVWRQS
jgi:hypothetical protein